MAEVHCFYHAWSDGQWRQPWNEFFHALRTTGFNTADDLTFNWSNAVSEAPTINLLRAHALQHDGVVLYAHTKGAHNHSQFRARWRKSMTYRVVSAWEKHAATLTTGDVDAVGCHWLTPQEYPGIVDSPFFGGNFWMARCDYLRTLPVCDMEPRFAAERWIGLGDPRVVDLLPGWPDDRRWPELLEVAC